jgi:hypothetical protein
MQKFTIKNAGATLRGPVDLRLFDVAVQQRNSAVLGGRWPTTGQFSLPEGQTITLTAGDVVLVSAAAALDDSAPVKAATPKSDRKAQKAD